jgi:hypothetical protein
MYRLLPLAPLFTLACLGLTFMVWQRTPDAEFLNAPWLLMVGLCWISVSVFLALSRRQSFPLAYDFFCLGTFCVWFVHWREAYRIDAPVFAWYPIFFVVLIVVLDRQVIHAAHALDPLQRKMIRLIYASWLFHPVVLTSGVLLGVWFSEYYIFYPIVLSLLLIRCSFGLVLRELAES